jgi:hypothetical protein
LPVENFKTKPALTLPLAFGSRQGREYFWHFDRDLRTRDEWTPLNARLLRVMPAAQENESAKEAALRASRAEFYLTITFQRLAPPVADLKAKELIGVDRGEAVPASFAVVDADGRSFAKSSRLRQFLDYIHELDKWEEANLPKPDDKRDYGNKPRWEAREDDVFGFIAPEYRDQQREFNNKKRELQQTKGGYTRWLRAKETVIGIADAREGGFKDHASTSGSHAPDWNR